MLLRGMREFHTETIDWELRECGMQGRFQSDLASLATFQFCLERMSLEWKNELSRNPARPRDGVLRAIGIDIEMQNPSPLLISHREVRSGVVALGEVIPEDSWFIGGHHIPVATGWTCRTSVRCLRCTQRTWRECISPSTGLDH